MSKLSNFRWKGMSSPIKPKKLKGQKGELVIGNCKNCARPINIKFTHCGLCLPLKFKKI